MSFPRLAINLLSIGQHPSGNKTYILSLLRELLPLLNEHTRPILLIAGRRMISVFTDMAAELAVFPDVSSKTLSRIALEQFFLPFWLRYQKIDLLFAPRNFAPLLTTTPTVLGIHSLHLNYAENKPAPASRRWLVNTLLRRAGQKAAAYLAISEYAGRTYLEAYGLSPERLRIAHHGIERNYRLESAHGRPILERYLLFVSTLHPHKNVELLLRIYQSIRQQHPTIKLIIIGRDPANEIDRLKALSHSLDIDQQVVFLGGVDDKTLHQYYQHAEIFLFPSLTEGFGLTPLEAMAHGLPVVVSNRTSLPEVVGDAGFIIDPTDEARWVSTVVEILNNDALREDLAARSRVQSTKFSWEESARITADTLLTVLEKTK